MSNAPGDIYLANNAVGIESVRYQDGIFLGNLDVAKILTASQKLMLGSHKSPNVTLDVSAV